MEDLKGVLGGLGEATLGPNVALLPAGGKGSGDGAGDEEVNYRIPLLSDKFTKSTSGSSKGGGDSNNPLTSWSFPFPGGTSLSVHPVGSFAHAGNAGLANKHANGIGGDVLPVLDVAILVDNKDDAFVGGKDYLNHRYADVSFASILCCHCLKFDVIIAKSSFSMLAHGISIQMFYLFYADDNTCHIVITQHTEKKHPRGSHSQTTLSKETPCQSRGGSFDTRIRRLA